MNMQESVFQTFLLLAYFDIALLSVTIANYAVSASYLGRETRLSRWRMERRRKKLIEKVRELGKKEPQIKEIRNEIKESDAEKRRLSTRIFLLSWLGAVILPSIFFAWSFVCAVIGVNSEILLSNDDSQFLQQQMMIFSLGTIIIGFMVLLNVIRTIDSAARKIPVPEFKVSFEKSIKTLECKNKELRKIAFCLKNNGEDVAEKFQIFICFPPAFKVHKNHRYIVFKQGTETDNPDYNAAIFLIDLLHIDTILYLDVTLTMPEKKGIYEIPISMYERKIGEKKHKLVIKIV